MAKELILSLDGHEITVQLIKLDREKLYGEVVIEAFDEKGKPATLKVLAADGKTLMDKGGTSLTTVNEDGDSISRTELLALDVDGEQIDPVPSSFGKPNVLKLATADDYLSQMIKTTYILQPAEGSDINFLYDHLSADQIYSFPFSYRGGLEFDNAFLLGKSDTAFMVVGKQAEFQFVRLNQAAVLDSVEDAEISADDLDFGLL